MAKSDSNLESIHDKDYPITEEQYIGKVVGIFPNVDSVFSKENVRYPQDMQSMAIYEKSISTSVLSRK